MTHAAAATLKIPEVPISADLARQMYTLLLRTRILEDEVDYICTNQTAQKPFITGKGYLSTGQEAISVGLALAIEADDWFAQSHRDMAAHLHRGMTPLDALWQYRATSKSPTQGKDGNIHCVKAGTNMVGFTSHMGQNVGVAVGLAWTQKYRKTDRVVVATFGEGAAQQGIVHESMNYAAVFKLPVLFAINNNRWAISVPLASQSPSEDLGQRGAAYEMPWAIVDGNDAIAVYRSAVAAVQWMRAGKGPVCIEYKSMRMAGHGTHDPATYIPKEEKEYWAKRDPVLRMRAYLIDHKLLDDAEDQALRAAIKREIDQAVEEAGEDVAPDPSVATQGVFAEPLPVE